MSLKGCLTLCVEDGLLLLLLQPADAGEGLQARQLASLSLLAKPAQESAVAGLCAQLLGALLAVHAAEGLLPTSQELARTERGLACAHACLLPKLTEAREGLAELGACAVELACLLPKDATKLLLRTEALLGSLAHLLGEALLGCKLLTSGGLEELAVALACCQPLLGGRAGHACELLLGAKALGCGLAKLAGKALLSREPLLGFGAKLARQGLLSPKALGTGGAEAPCLGCLCRKALGLGLPEGRSETLLGPELLASQAGETGGRCPLCLALASELAHGRLLSLLEASRAQCADGLPKAPPKGALALSGAQASSGAECRLAAPGDVAGAGCDILLRTALQDVGNRLLDHRFFVGVHEGAGHAGIEAPGGAAEEPSRLAQGPTKLASCLLREALHAREACTKAARSRAGHAELLPEACL